MKNIKHYRPLYTVFLRSILYILIPSLLILSAVHYYQTHDTILSAHNESKKLTANSIANSLFTIDRGYRMLERALDNGLKDQFALFLREYENSGRNPLAMDLEKLKKESGMNLDLYIINRQGIIIATTYETDLGLDFSKYKDFYKHIQLMMDNYQFYSDRLVPETQTLTLRKYAYHTTPDKKYLLELGIQYNEFSDYLGELDPQIIATNLIKLNNDLLNITLIDTGGNNLSAVEPETITDYRMLDIIEKLIANPQRTITQNFPDKKTEKDYFFVKLSKTTDPSKNDRIVELTYSTKRMNELLIRNTLLHLAFSLVVILGAVAAAVYSSMKITTPIHTIVRDVNSIAEGDLNRRVEEHSSNEIRILEKSINKMVNSLNTNIKRAEESEQKLKKYNEDLEDLVKERSSELLQAEKLASLGNLVAGVAHEINTPVGIGVTAASHLSKLSRDLNRKFASGAMTKSDFSNYLEGSSESVTILTENLNKASELIRSFKKLAVDQTAEDTRKFNLEEILNNLMLSLHPRLKHTNHSISIDCGNIEIKNSPGLFYQIFTNLIINSLVHAYDTDNDGGQISISAKIEKKNEEETLKLKYSDDGKGIPDEIQKKIFDPFFTTKRSQGGSGLGLHIIHNIVTQNLQGKINCISGSGKGCIFTIEIPIKKS